MKNKFFLYFLYIVIFNCVAQQPTDLSLGQITSAITWQANGGRFGDNLFSYSKAKWLSYKYNIPVLYVPFKYSDQLILHTQEKIYSSQLAQQFAHIIYLPRAKYTLSPYNNTLYISNWQAIIPIDWNDIVFIEELKKNILPCYEIEKITIPADCISIAVHVRNGGGFVVDNEQERERCPLRFVPDEFFIDQVARISDIFPQQKLYVHIFTDHLEPAHLLKKFQKTLNNPLITFGCRINDNHHNANVLEDFFFMMDFDCLIRPGSHFSRFVQRLGSNKLVIYPESIKTVKGKKIINAITVKTRTHVGAKWKTKKITIA